MFPTQVRALGAGITQSFCRIALAVNVAAVPAFLAAVGIKTIAIYSITYLICLGGILVGAGFLDNTRRSLEIASGET